MLFNKTTIESPEMVDLIPFKTLSADGELVGTLDGGFMQSVSLKLYDAEGMSEIEQEAMYDSFFNEINQLFGDFKELSIYFDTYRSEIGKYSTSEKENFSGNEVPYYLDLERSNLYSEKLKLMSEMTISFKIKPSSSENKTDNILKFLTNTDKSVSKDDAEDNNFKKINNFRYAVKSFVKSISGVVKSAKLLTKSDLVSYLHSTFNPMNPTKISFQLNYETLLFLDSWLSDASFIGHNEHPQIYTKGKRYYCGFVSVRSWPRGLTPELADIVNTLNFPCRYSMRFITMSDREFNFMLTTRRTLLAGASIKSNSVANQITGGFDQVNLDKSFDAYHAETAFNEGERFGQLTSQYFIWDEDLEKLNEKLNKIEDLTRKIGVVTKRETFNSCWAYTSTIPGEDISNKRRDVCTLKNAIYSSPICNHWEGEAKNLVVPDGGAPLFYATSKGNTPFMFSTHYPGEGGQGGEIAGHTMVVGQTGGGKSVLLTFIAMQFAKYGGRVIFFDKRCSALVPTLISGGRHFDFSEFDSNTGVGIQPLRYLDNANDRSNTDVWIRKLIQDRTIKTELDQQDMSYIGDTLDKLSKCPERFRTLSNFKDLVQSTPIKRIMHDYVSGSFAGLFDKKEQAVIDDKYWWTTFEIGKALESEEVGKPLLRYLFNHIETVLDSKPTLIIIDEAYDFLKDEYFASKFSEMLRQYRKLNTWVLMATQSLADLLEHKEIANSISNNMMNKIYLPSQEIKREEIRKLYKTMGITDYELFMLEHSKPKRDYFFTTKGGNKIAQLELGDLALSVCAASGTTDVLKAREIMSKEQKLDMKKWFEYKNIPENTINSILSIEK